MTVASIIEDVKKRLDSEDARQHILIMVAGGSATGKSTQVLPELLSAFGDQALHMEQDWYQLGLDFSERDTSPYRWDDPRNFQIERLVSDLKKLKSGQPVTAPSFDVVSVRSVGERIIVPRPVIIVDGLYALYEGLGELADYGIYVSMPLYGRFLQRLFRMLYDPKQDKPQTAFKQVCGSVLKAHNDFVARQAQSADCIVEIHYDFANTISRYHLNPQSDVVPDGATTLFSDGALNFRIVKEESGCRFYISYHEQLYYDFFIESAYTPLLNGLDFTAV